MAQSPSHPVMTQVAIRREILRFVTNLSGSVAARSAEQGLLNLKQKYPEEFQDICLYSEVSIQLATYNFRLTSRKFLQELFLDINFEPVGRKRVIQLRLTFPFPVPVETQGS